MAKIYKKDINKLMPILQALEKGKTIQFADTDKEWVDSDEDGLLLETLINNPQSYRVKPEPKFRPFKNAEECWEEMQKHHPFGWVTFDCDTKRRNISSLLFRNTLGNEWIELSNGEWLSPHNMFKTMKFIDGSPFGVKVGG